jgi:hypothetical protein
MNKRKQRTRVFCIHNVCADKTLLTIPQSSCPARVVTETQAGGKLLHDVWFELTKRWVKTPDVLRLTVFRNCN